MRVLFRHHFARGPVSKDPCRRDGGPEEISLIVKREAPWEMLHLQNRRNGRPHPYPHFNWGSSWTARRPAGRSRTQFLKRHAAYSDIAGYKRNGGEVDPTE